MPCSITHSGTGESAKLLWIKITYTFIFPQTFLHDKFIFKTEISIADNRQK
jgi:hypothetical protein